MKSWPLLAWIAVAPFVTHSAYAADPQPPNVILIMCDDLGWGDVGFHGNQTVATPHIDALAAAGLRLERFYAAAPVCSPTRGSCLTGRHPSRYGIFGANDGHLPRAETTLAEILKAAGYSTGMFGKWHLGTLTTEVRDSNRGGPRGAAHFSPPAQHGFDVAFVTEAKVPTHDPLRMPKGGTRQKAWDALRSGDPSKPYGTRYWDIDGNEVTTDLDGDDSRVIIDRALKFIDKCAADDDAFLAVIWLHAPHLPVVASADDRARYQDLDVLARNYFGCIAALDRQIGRLRDHLANRGAENDTLIWFCSDNGPEGSSSDAPGTAGPFRGRKRSLYEGGVRVPAVVVWPSVIEPASQSHVPAGTSDILPTIADLLRIRLDPSRALDGESIFAVFQGESWRRAHPIGFHFRDRVAWTAHRYKLVGRRDADQLELYDLHADPSESHDLSATHPEVVARMKPKLSAWLADCATDLANSATGKP